MPVLPSSPFLPQGAQTWGVHDWAQWPHDRRQETLGAFLEGWEACDAPTRTQRLLQMSETCGLLLLLAGERLYRASLFNAKGEGFEWVVSAQPLPWIWGAAPLVAGPVIERAGSPWTVDEFWSWLDAQPVPVDSTGTWASLVWFHALTGLLAWWDTCLKQRLGNGYQVGTLDIGVSAPADVVLTGRRYGLSLNPLV